ncbi:T6SS phospholipase effector Tle1-like catalytic domain-containing protein [Ralstonia mannitolilytica]|uniref:T6SS phospholipase effector Tle1-like catalytic domain-containing protein n=1 Tax=Ralstonia mannitolilytica TaxID=105219 RepID=UPI000696A0D6|nr:DUF2235 domain-containing protein [Ralstonia mannitolilytica]QIF08115.1 DUF2235 domain-containing protein [Ralstonia mannitolilytica]CAJ0725748.1 hypothetical protein R76706_00784 [Ralstonia mannitolilytica]CAJ0775426.1 hypothetical protein R77555_00065 [Ralstonia mannitolilytica]
MTDIDFALNPDLDVGRTRSKERPLSEKETMQRMCALNALLPKSRIPSCDGNLFVGMFFDGTGNNEDEDYKKHRGDPRHQKHSNVVRLYHAYPDLKEKKGTDAYYRYYIPGVGTPFDKVGDDGTVIPGVPNPLGSAAGWGGAPRIFWGLIQVLNAIHRYFHERGLISESEAKDLCNPLSFSPTNFAKRFSVSANPFHALLNTQRTLNYKRRLRELKDVYQARLKTKIRGQKPELRLINLSVFGFSRGAAEARAFVNWLYELCEQKDGGWLFAGIPLRIQFLGIFDTVASVGLAGLYPITEGRQDWADDNMQIHPAVERCLHLVAGHEIRACFPLDSVRVDSKYPPNCKEYVFPGSHSDVGGGYMPLALGKADWSRDGKNTDLQLARVPGFEMYCAALAAGVPFYSPEELAERREQHIFDALAPSKATLDALAAYYQHANIQPGPVEEMARQHLSWYFSHRWQLLEAGFHKTPQYQRARGEPNADQGKDFRGEATWMLHTQRALVQMIAASCHHLEQRMQLNREDVEQRGEALRSPFELGAAAKNATAQSWGSPAAAIYHAVRHQSGPILDDARQPHADAVAKRAPAVLARWRRWLADNMYPEVRNADAPERDVIRLLEALRSRPVPEAIGNFFDAYVHDSMAGFIGFGMPEFQLNGYGLAKFRRIYFGNAGDKIIRDRIKHENEQRIAEARGQRNEAAAARMPPRIPPMSEWFRSL